MIPNQRMSPQKGDHFKRKFHLPTIDFQGMFVRPWSNMLIFLKIDTYIYTYICTTSFHLLGLPSRT